MLPVISKDTSQHSSLIRTPWIGLCAMAAAGLTACSLSENRSGDTGKHSTMTPDAVTQSGTPLPEFMQDGCEPVNRGIWELNKGFNNTVMVPSGRVYRGLVPKPVRGSINDFTRNITWPGRFVNHVLQGRWSGAGGETLRFFCNSTVGVGGFFDVASNWRIPKSDANFSQTFGKWGWQPQSFIMLPFYGPSDGRHAIGLAADEASQPWNYSYPYTIASYTSVYNHATGITEEARRLSQSEPDSYELVKYAWSYGSKDQQPDWSPKGPVDVPTLQTLRVATFSCKDPDFLVHAREISVRIPATGRKLKFEYWLQPGPAPLVYIAPGLSSHRLSTTTLLLAETLYRNGFSVVSSTSVFHPEFMENASSSALPIYPPDDSRDLLVAITEADRALVAKYPGRFEKRALVGFSMGGFMAMRMAAYENQASPELLRFDRYVAICAPVDLVHGAGCLDAFQDAPKAWPADTRQARVNNTLHKVAAIGVMTSAPSKVPPFDKTESEYLIGFTFRIGLRDVIFSSQMRNNMGVLQTPLSSWNRETCYQEIMKFSYRDYFLKFAVPYYQKKGISLNQLTRETNLRTHESLLRKQPKIRVLVNRNDFLLPPGDLEWLQATLPPSQLKVFPDGGHLGNLSDPPMQKAVFESLSGLISPSQPISMASRDHHGHSQITSQ